VVKWGDNLRLPKGKKMTRVAPQKECPVCKAKLHVKKAACECGHLFYTRKGSTPIPKGVGKSPRNAPQKECPSCNKKCHVKLSKCNCGHLFYKAKYKPESIAKADIDQGKEIGGKTTIGWRSLVPGDIIKSVKGHGPFWVNPRNGERVYMGSYGRFKIKQVLKDGIMGVAYSKNCKNQFEFIYMGEMKQSKLTDNLYRSPHKLFRMKRNDND
jgi:hypothetical protein